MNISCCLPGCLRVHVAALKRGSRQADGVLEGSVLRWKIQPAWAPLNTKHHWRKPAMQIPSSVHLWATHCLQRRRVSSSPPAWTCPTSHAGGTASDGPCVATGCLAQEKLSHYRTVIVARNKHIDIQVAPAWQIPGIPRRLQGLLVEKKQLPATSWQSAKVLISYIHTSIDTHFLLSTTALIVQERTFHSAIPKVRGTEN